MEKQHDHTKGKAALSVDAPCPHHAQLELLERFVEVSPDADIPSRDLDRIARASLSRALRKLSGNTAFDRRCELVDG